MISPTQNFGDVDHSNADPVSVEYGKSDVVLVDHKIMVCLNSVYDRFHANYVYMLYACSHCKVHAW